MGIPQVLPAVFELPDVGKDCSMERVDTTSRIVLRAFTAGTRVHPKPPTRELGVLRGEVISSGGYVVRELSYFIPVEWGGVLTGPRS